MSKESAFLHFEVLPRVCIHSLKADEYSKMYTPQEKCDCGCSEWIESTMMITADDSFVKLPPKGVHRCINCNEVRTATHIGYKD